MQRKSHPSKRKSKSAKKQPSTPQRRQCGTMEYTRDSWSNIPVTVRIL